MSQVVGMATAYHEHAGISSVICFHIIMHVLPLNKENKQQKTLPFTNSRVSTSCSRAYCLPPLVEYGILTIGIRARTRRRHVALTIQEAADW